MLRAITWIAAFSATGILPLSAQYLPGKQGSSNVHVVAHVRIGGQFHATDLEIEQELSRPYVYASGFNSPTVFTIISLKDPAKAKVLYTWKIENSMTSSPGSGR
jgi:hypothetical protein